MQNLTLKSFASLVETSKTNYAGFVKLSEDGQSVQKVGTSFFARHLGLYTKPTMEENRQVRQALYNVLRSSGLCQEDTLASIKRDLKLSGADSAGDAGMPLSRADLKRIMNQVTSAAPMAILGTDDVGQFMEYDVMKSFSEDTRQTLKEQFTHVVDLAKTQDSQATSEAKKLHETIRKNYCAQLTERNLDLAFTKFSWLSSHHLSDVFADAIPQNAPLNEMTLSEDAQMKLLNWTDSRKTGISDGLRLAEKYENTRGFPRQFCANLENFIRTCPFITDSAPIKEIVAQHKCAHQFCALLHTPNAKVTQKQCLEAFQKMQDALSNVMASCVQSASKQGITLGDVARKQIADGVMGLFMTSWYSQNKVSSSVKEMNQDVIGQTDLLSAYTADLAINSKPHSNEIFGKDALVTTEADLKEGHDIAGKLKLTSLMLDSIKTICLPDTAPRASAATPMSEDMLQFFNSQCGIGIQRNPANTKFKQFASASFDQTFMNLCLASSEKDLKQMTNDAVRDGIGMAFSIQGKSLSYPAYNLKELSQQTVRQELDNLFALDTTHGEEAKRILGKVVQQGILGAVGDASMLTGEPVHLSSQAPLSPLTTIQVSQDQDGSYLIDANLNYPSVAYHDKATGEIISAGNGTVLQTAIKMKLSFNDAGQGILAMREKTVLSGHITVSPMPSHEIEDVLVQIGVNHSNHSNNPIINTMDAKTLANLTDVYNMLEQNNPALNKKLTEKATEVKEAIEKHCIGDRQLLTLDALGLSQTLKELLMSDFSGMKLDRTLIDNLISDDPATRTSARANLQAMLFALKEKNVLDAEPELNFQALALIKHFPPQPADWQFSQTDAGRLATYTQTDAGKALLEQLNSNDIDAVNQAKTAMQEWLAQNPNIN